MRSMRGEVVNSQKLESTLCIITYVGWKNVFLLDYLYNRIMAPSKHEC